MKEKVIFNWSGGKDSAMCLHKMMLTQQYDIMCLLTSINEQYQRISMHGVRVDLLVAQAESIHLPLIQIQIPEMPTMEVYERVMTDAILSLKDKGATASMFGDIFLEDLRTYRENKLQEIGLKGIFPFWKIPTDQLVREFIDLGFKAIITCVNERCLDKSFAGRFIDHEFLNDLPDHVDPCGENGEFHSFVFDGPIFERSIPFDKGEIVYKKYSSPNPTDQANNDEDTNGPFDFRFWYCDLLLREATS